MGGKAALPEEFGLGYETLPGAPLGCCCWMNGMSRRLLGGWGDATPHFFRVLVHHGPGWLRWDAQKEKKKRCDLPMNYTSFCGPTQGFHFIAASL